MDTPEHIMKKIRSAHGLDQDDSNRDDEFNKLSPNEKLKCIVGWEFGDEDWAEQILGWVEDCGYKIRE